MCPKRLPGVGSFSAQTRRGQNQITSAQIRVINSWRVRTQERHCLRDLDVEEDGLAVALQYDVETKGALRHILGARD